MKRPIALWTRRHSEQQPDKEGTRVDRTNQGATLLSLWTGRAQ